MKTLETDLLKTLALKQYLGDLFFIVEDNTGEPITLEGDEDEIREQYLEAFPKGSEENADFQTFESYAIENCMIIGPEKTRTTLF